MTWRALQQMVAAHRRLVAGLLAGLAVLALLGAVRPAAPPSVTVLAAARDLAAGTPIALADLRSVALPVGAVPAGALRPGAAVLGRLVAGPVRRGEPLTDVRILGPPLLAAVGRGPDLVAVPVRFADAGAVTLLRPGDRIDVLASPVTSTETPAAAPTARVVAADIAVLVVAATDPTGLGGGGAAGVGVGDGTLVVVACSPAVARALAGAGAAERLSPALRSPALPSRALPSRALPSPARPPPTP
ncbi:MAG: pilus assembly protein CpaB [Frankiaceae bacterium]|nr:pilus assembly protein CpaB [Frankiaceae bacterium]